MWIVFDGGAATLPANGLSFQDHPDTYFGDGGQNFIGAIDSSGAFTSVTVFGDGFGYLIYAGGTFRFGLVPLNSVDVGGAIPSVPEPETWAMLLAGLGIIGFTAKRHSHQIA